MDKIIEAITGRLAEQVPELTWIDTDLGQLAFEEPPVDYPCALIDVSNIDYSSYQQNTQKALVEIDINLAFTVFSQSDFTAPEHIKEQAAEHYKIVRKVYQALQGFETPNFSKLNRTSLKRQKNTYPRHFTMSFQTAYTDYCATPQYRQMELKPIIEVNPVMN